MLSNYIKASLRNFKKRRAFTITNILGLAVGIASFLILMQYTYVEENYDHFHAKKDHIFRIIFERYKGADLVSRWENVAPGMGNTILEEFPEVEAMTRFKKEEGAIIKLDDAFFEEEKVYYVDSSFFSVFSFPLKVGNPQFAFREPFSVVLTESAAYRYFGSINVLNKELEIANGLGKQVCNVTGVVEDPPNNSSLDFELLISFNTMHNGQEWFQQTWDYYAFPTYILLSPSTNYKELEAKFPPYVAKYKNDPAEAGKEWKFYLQPLADVHLYSDFSTTEAKVDSKARTINLLKIISLLIILISWVNYINLSTARSTERAKEVGIRKAVGAYKYQIARQFMVESALVNIGAGILALGIVLISIKGFNQIIGANYGFDLFEMGSFWLNFGAIIVLGIFLSGMYPSFVLSSFKPRDVLKSKAPSGSGSILFRRILVGLQFAISAILITCTIIITYQNNFMKNKDLGVDINGVMVIKRPQLTGSEEYLNTMEAFKTELRRSPGVSLVSSSFSVPTVGTWGLNVKISTDEQEKQNMHRVIGVDDNYFSTFNLPLIEGRFFSQDLGKDKNAIIVSKKALELLEIRNPKDAIGKKLNIETFGLENFEVIGVVEDYHHLSLQKEILPMVYLLNGQGLFSTPKYFSLKLAVNADVNQEIGEAKASFTQFYPGNPFQYFFLDEEFNRQYVEEDRNQNVFSLFATLAIILACLGVLGLSAFMAVLKTREIAIRKVIGAELQHISILLSKEFIYLTIIAQIVAIPVIYYLMNDWLSNYPYRISIEWWFFIIAIGILLGITLLVISFNVYKAAKKKPLESLRLE